MKKISKLFIGSILVFSMEARSDFFGGDIAVLTQILGQAIQQLYQLKQIYREGQDSLDLLRNINRGINDSLILIRTVYPNADPGLFKEWDRLDRALHGVQELYGGVAPSPEARIQKDTDQNIAEAITLNNSIYKYTKDVDEISEEIKRFSHAVSPGGAQKLTAQSLGVMLNVLNQTLRTHATGLKIQAHSLAIQNYKEKEATKKQIETSNTLSASMKSQDVSFQLPRL